MFQDLFLGQLQLFHLNFGTITLLPKKTEAVRIEQFRPICLLNVTFIIFIKVGTKAYTDCAFRGAAVPICFHAGQKHPRRGCGSA